MRGDGASPRAALPHRAVVVALLAASACASTTARNVSLAEATPDRGWRRVENVAEVRQASREDCGAAALAMVLAHWGSSVTRDQIWSANRPPPGQGLRADVLRDLARAEGLEAFLVEGNREDLDREIAKDRPVLVGVMKVRGRRAFPHYEVVVGINDRGDRILTLDPARGATESSVEDFTKEWVAAGRLTLVVFPAETAASVARSRP